jgi:hypothetical protein
MINHDVNTTTRRPRVCKVLLTLLMCAAGAFGARAQVPGFGRVCGDAADPNCTQGDGLWRPFNLSFITGRYDVSSDEPVRSQYFYAVILESVAAENKDGGCNYVGEAKRLAAQKLFPHHKFFSSRNFCGDDDGAVSPDYNTLVIYEGARESANFLAVYGGTTRKAADEILAQAKKQYPGANIRRLRVSIVFNGDV